MRFAGSLFAEMRMAGDEERGRADEARRRNEGPAAAVDEPDEGTLAQALALAVRVEALLADSPPEMESAGVFRMRLARAHVLGLIDQLSVMVDPGTRRTLRP